jgi:pSer/pThr/pTyr-binding forkhead associated (FHA) protein
MGAGSSRDIFLWRGDVQIQLKVLTGSSEGKLVPVTQDKFLIGRADECQLRPKSDSISRRHCAIVQKDDRLLLIDLKSRNGTSVNGKKLDPSKAKVLKHGDHIQVGKLEFEVVIQVGIASKKKSEVKDVKEAAVRSAENTGDSRYEEVDVSSWLEEADQIKRDRNEPVTRQFNLADSARIDISSDSTVMDAKGDDETQTSAPVPAQPAVPATAPAAAQPSKKPMKLPPKEAKPLTGSSKDAASETLRKFFGGR